MTLLLDNPWLLVFYMIAALLGILFARVKLPRMMGLVNLLLHAGAILVMFLLGGGLEDVLLFLLFSSAVSLLASYVLGSGEDKK